MPSLMFALSIVNAKKTYQQTTALRGVSLDIQAGEFFGLLGPNGAGKTTLISSIVGLCRLTEGQISVFGHDVRQDYLQARRLVGYSPQEINLDRFFSIKKILFYQAGFFGVPRKNRSDLVDRLLTQFKLTDKAHQQYYRLSGGMQRRVLMAKALVGSPKILILDEPTAGVDVEQRHELWGFLKNLNRDGTTIILTTHYIDEAESLCQRIGIIHQGQIREVGLPAALISKYCHSHLRVTWKQEGQESVLTESFKGQDMAALLSELEKKRQQNPSLTLVDVVIDRGNLEQAFLKVTGENIA